MHTALCKSMAQVHCGSSTLELRHMQGDVKGGTAGRREAAAQGLAMPPLLAQCTRCMYRRPCISYGLLD